MSLKTRKIDCRSLRFKLWLNFIIFAAILLIVIWCLQVFFLRTYYEEMKSDETRKIARQIQAEFNEDDHDITTLGETIQDISSSNDMTIIVMNATDGSLEINTDHMAMENQSSPFMFNRYSNEINELYSKLINSKFNSAQTMSSGRVRNRTMGYACYLTGSTKQDSEDSYVLFLFSPLFPVKSTITILRSQLGYITIISILLALVLSLFISTRISRPLKDITASAREMGKGNYDVKFRGGQYTEINELAETLTHTETELARTEMYQKDLIANVSHDLRTPLTMIKSYAEMIRDLSGDNPEKRNKHLKVIIDETDRLNSLVNDMLNLSKMQSHKIVLSREPFNLTSAVSEVVASYSILEENDGYDIEYNGLKEPCIVDGDEAKIKQVMINLVNNAVKYCGEDKKIVIDMVKNGRTVRFTVTDHGRGIAPDELSHVWERYYKSSTHHVRPTEGSGLGLSIVKEILTLHGADYGVESEVNKGSTFWFEMPLLKKKI